VDFIKARRMLSENRPDTWLHPTSGNHRFSLARGGQVPGDSGELIMG
jgi:hypothetical protein